jgi:hypothetical protein
MMEEIYSSDTSVLIKAKKGHIAVDGFSHSHRRGNLISYVDSIFDGLVGIRSKHIRKRPIN